MLDPKKLQEIVSDVLALDINELREAIKDAEILLNSYPEGHWMRGLLGVSMVSAEALLNYRVRLEEIGDELLGGLDSLGGLDARA